MDSIASSVTQYPSSYELDVDDDIAGVAEARACLDQR